MILVRKIFGRRSTTSIFYELLFAFGVEPAFFKIIIYNEYRNYNSGKNGFNSFAW